MITDRGVADVEYALKLIRKKQAGQALTDEEWQQYAQGLRGCYNISDLNRVENKVSELSVKLAVSGYPNAVAARVWTQGDILTDTEITRYLANVAALRAAYYVKAGTPETPGIDRWVDYISANDIERILVDIEELIAAKDASSQTSGMFYAEARRALPLRRD